MCSARIEQIPGHVFGGQINIKTLVDDLKQAGWTDSQILYITSCIVKDEKKELEGKHGMVYTYPTTINNGSQKR